MTLRTSFKQGLRRLGYEVVVPAAREPGWQRHIRLQRPPFPEEAARTYRDGCFTIGVDRLVNRLGFGYGPDDWNPYRAALEEQLARPGLPYAESVLARFYERFRPRTVHEALLDGTGCPPGTLATWPAVDRLIDVWSVTGPRASVHRARHANAAVLPHSAYRGPAAAEDGEPHLRRLVSAFRAVQAEGYRPDAYGYLTGYFASRGEDYVFVVGHGNHRASGLALHGIEQVPVMLRAAHAGVVPAEDLTRWTRSGGGLLEDEEALAVVERLLARDGADRAAALGLL